MLVLLMPLEVRRSFTVSPGSFASRDLSRRFADPYAVETGRPPKIHRLRRAGRLRRWKDLRLELLSTDRRREQQLAGLTSDRLLGPLSRASASGADQSATTVLIAFGANLLVAIAKTVAAALTSSASLVAEAAHSWADTGNEIFLLVAGRRARRPPDRAHPLGHGREAYVWSLLAAIGLFVAGAAVSLTHGVQELRNPEPASDFVVGYVVLAFSFVVEGISFACRCGRRSPMPSFSSET